MTNGLAVPTPIGHAPSHFDAGTLAAVYKSFADAQAAIPDGHTHAFIVTANESKADGLAATVAFVQKAPHGWDVLTEFGYDKSHGFDVGAQLAKSW